MKTKLVPIFVVLLCSGFQAVFAATVIELRVNPGKVLNKGNSSVAIWVLEDGKPAQKPVKLEVVGGQECGQIFPASVTVPGDGTPASAVFTGKEYVEDCAATIRASTGDAKAESRVTVNPIASARALDGVTALAAVLIASFAIDRTVRGLLFLLSFWKRWAAAFPDSPENKKLKLVYVSVAGLLGIVVLGWFGQVRILGALGFSAVNPYLDIIVTGFVLVGGADRTEDILRRIGASGSAAHSAGAAVPSAPIEITGRLVLDDQSHGEAASVKRAGTNA